MRRTQGVNEWLRTAQWLPMLPVVLAPVVLFADVLFTGRSLIWGLPAIQFVPWRYYAYQNLAQGVLPLWNPLNGMGAPLMANYQLALYYPPGWLLYLLAAVGGAPWLAWGHTLLLVLHMIWAGVGMARLAASLSLGRQAQTVAGLAFALCGFMTARSSVFPMVWAAAWIPWVLMYSHRLACEEGRVHAGNLVKLAVTVAMLLLVGHAQIAWYGLLLAGVWVVVIGWSRHGLRIAILRGLLYALAMLVAALLASAQLVPTAEYLLQSQRSSAVDYELGMTYSFWPWRVLTLLAPEIFGNPGLGDYWGYASYWEDALYTGMLPLLLALTTLPQLINAFKRPASPGQKHLIRLLWAVILVAFVLALGKNTPVFPFLYRYVPTFSLFQAPARFVILIEIALVLLAAIGVENWRKPKGARLRWLKRGLVASVAIALGAGATLIILRDVEITFVRATLLASIFILATLLLALRKPPGSEPQRETRWFAWVASVVTVDLLVAGAWLHPATASSYYTPNYPVNDSLRAQLAGNRLYLSQDEEYRLKFMRFFRFDDFRPIEDWAHLRQVMLPNSNLLDGVASVNNFDPMVPSRYSFFMEAVETLSETEREKWLRMMGVGLVEQININLPIGVAFTKVDAPFRWYWADCAEPAESEEDSWQRFNQHMSAWSGTGQPDWVVIENATPQTCSPGGAAQVRLVREGANEWAFEVEAERDGWLVMNQTWYPGWTGRVDGAPVDVFRANYLFQSVPVAAGKHMVVFNYSPVSASAGRIVSGLGWLFLILLLVIKKIRS